RLAIGGHKHSRNPSEMGRGRVIVFARLHIPIADQTRSPSLNDPLGIQGPNQLHRRTGLTPRIIVRVSPLAAVLGDLFPDLTQLFSGGYVEEPYRIPWSDGGNSLSIPREGCGSQHLVLCGLA